MRVGGRASPALLASAVASALVPGVGCSPDFDNVSTVSDLRVLAIVADTPEILVDDFDALPDAFPSVTLRPLVVDPAGRGRPVRYRVVVCANGDGGTERGRDNGAGRVRDTIARGRCPDESALVAEGEATPPFVSPAGVGASAAGADIDVVVPIAVTHTITRAFVMQALAADPAGRLFGTPVDFEFTFTAGDEEVVAKKRVLLSPRLDPAQAPNRNPVIDALTVRERRRDTPAPLAAGDPPPEVALAGELVLEPARGEQEPYKSWVYRRSEGRLGIEQIERETLRYTFFATRGTFSPHRVSTEPSLLRSNPSIDLESMYEAPDELPAGAGDRVDVWIVVRDERAGASVLRLALRLK